MKILKGLAITFVLSITFACVGVQADSALSLIGVDIPGWDGEYVTKNVKKTIENNQYVKTSGITDNRGVQVLLKNTNGDRGTNKTLAQSGCRSIIGTDGVGIYPGTYNLTFSTTGWHVTTTEFSGVWLIDGGLYGTMCK